MSNRSSLIAIAILILALVGSMILILSNTPTPPPNPTPSFNQYSTSRQPRPELGGRELTYGTEHFLVHYTDEGDNAMPPLDADNNGVPDFVERVAGGMEQAWAYQIGGMGFASPPPDGGIGGDDRFDIYLQRISYFGYNSGGGGIIGDNPLTPQSEGRAAFSYMALDNTFEDYTKYGVTVYDALDITSAHEFNHSVQYGYDANEELWLMESTAALIEELAYPSVNDNIGYLVAQTDTPDQCLPRSEAFYHAYSHWYFLKYLVENHPDGERIIPRIWEQARGLDGLWALDAALNGELDRYWGNWVVANLARQNCPDGAPYCMAEAALYPPVIIEGRLTPNEWDGYLTYVPPSGVGSYGVDYIDLTPMDSTRVPLDLAFVGKTRGVKYTVHLVGFKGSPTPEITELPLGGDPAVGAIRFDAKQYDRLYLTVENRTPALEANCGRVQGDYVLGVTRVGERAFLDASSISAPPLVRPGEKFDITLDLRALVEDEPSAAVTINLPPDLSLDGAPTVPAGTVVFTDTHTLQWEGAISAAATTLTLPARVADDAPVNSPFEITAAVAGSRLPEGLTLAATVHAPPEILIVDDAGYSSKSESLIAALDFYGLRHDVWRTVDRGSPTAETLKYYPTVIWNTGQTNVETLIADDRAALADYLASGGRLILVGTDVVYEQSQAGTGESRTFLAQALGVQFEQEAYQLNEGTVTLTGASGETFELAIPFSEPEVGGPPDVIAPIGGKSAALLTYPDGRGAAVRSADGRVAVIALDFSQLSAEDGAVLARTLLPK